MSTLLLRLAGPLQSWGVQSRFEFRDTGLEPSKSGVVGLLCAALGRERAAPVDDLARLRLGVRVDREGKLSLDYHTAGGSHRRDERYGVYQIDDTRLGVSVSRRYYLADADFLVGLASREAADEALLEELDAALARPRWQLYLGRKAFVPGVPVRVPDGLRRGVELEAALREHPWPGLGVRVPLADRRPERLRVVLEGQGDAGEDVRRDQPVGAAFQERQFALRHVTTSFYRLGDEVPVRAGEG